MPSTDNWAQSTVAPAAPATANKVAKPQRTRGEKNIRAKKAEKALQSAAEAGPVAAEASARAASASQSAPPAAKKAIPLAITLAGGSPSLPSKLSTLAF
ncbi:hypothetical protein LT330_007153 [Penicillium expansum]|nr:hypothetical protein LT330_007153 [Penicillium expansum]